MAKDPAFLFYPGDFLNGVTFLNFEDRGKYITILCHMHQHGRLTEESICFLVGSVSVMLKSKFLIDENNCWYNDRLENEILKRKKFTESRVNNGKSGGRPKKNKETETKPNEKPYGLATENHMRNRNRNEDNNDIIILKGGTGGNFKTELLSSEQILEVLCMQTRIGRPQAEYLRDCFVLQAEATDEGHSNYSDYSKHFINWAKKNLHLLDAPKAKSKIGAAHSNIQEALEIINRNKQP